jgi:predicted RNase H-like HicB family nuclease
VIKYTEPREPENAQGARGEEPVTFTVESEQETDGRWLAEIPELPGVLAYGESREDAVARTQALALRVLADRIEHGEGRLASISFAAA